MYSIDEIRKNYKEFSDSKIENIAKNESKGLRKDILGILKGEIEKRNLDKNLISGVEAEHPDSKIGAAIFNKYARKIEDANEEDYVKIIKSMVSELKSKHPDTFSVGFQGPGIIKSFLEEEGFGKNYKEELRKIINDMLLGNENEWIKEEKAKKEIQEFIDYLKGWGWIIILMLIAMLLTGC